MELSSELPRQKNVVYILTDDKYLGNLQENLTVTTDRMRKLKTWKTYVDYVAFDSVKFNSQKNGKYTSRGGLEVTVDFGAETIRYGKSKTMQIVSVFKRGDALVVSIAGFLSTATLRDSFVADFWVNAGPNFVTLIAKQSTPTTIIRLCSVNTILNSRCDQDFYADMLQHHFGEKSKNPKERFIYMASLRRRVIDLFENIIDRFSWFDVVLHGNSALTEDFIIRHWYDEGRGGIGLWNHKALSEEFIEEALEEYPDPNDDGPWQYICLNPSMSEAFFERHIDKVNWTSLSRNPSMSQAFFERHLDKVDWSRLSEHPSMSEAFFERHLDKVNWTKIRSNPSLSDAFFERHIKRVNWSSSDYTNYPSLTENFWERHLDKMNWSDMCGQSSLSEAFFERHLDKVYWFGLLTNSNVSIAFIMRHKEVAIEALKDIFPSTPELVFWGAVSSNENITEAFAENHIKYMNWDHLCQNPSLPESFFRRYIDKIDWLAICANTSMSPEFFMEYREYIDNWDYLSRNNFGLK